MECHRRSQAFLWGCTFFLKKLTFFSRHPQNRLKLLNEPLRPSKSPHRAKNVLKIDSCSAGGALTNFPVNYACNFFVRPGGSRCTRYTPWLCLCGMHNYVHIAECLWILYNKLIAADAINQFVHHMSHDSIWSNHSNF